MRSRFLKQAVLERLRAAVPENLAAYRGGNFAWLAGDPAHTFEVEVEIDNVLLAKLRPPAGQQLFERENCALVYRALRNLTPYEARDERIWTYLTHVDMLNYTRLRWEIPGDDLLAVPYVRKHFFAREKRQVERDNSASRLWWMAHLCARVSNLELEQSLETLLFRSDVRASIIERPTSSQCSELFGVIVRRLSKSLVGNQALFERNTFRRFMREINSVGGFKLLDCLSTERLELIIEEIITHRLGLTSL